MSKRIDPKTLPIITGTLYPAPYDEPCRTRERTRLGDVAGLTQYGVNLLRLPPGAWSSQRHWHTGGDEFIYILSGEVTLVTDDGDEILRAGDAAGFKANDPNGHCLQNRSAADVTRARNRQPHRRARPPITPGSIWSRPSPVPSRAATFTPTARPTRRSNRR